MPQGTVSWFDTGKGFGFVAPEDGTPDVFVHASQVDGGVLLEGAVVEFDVRESDRGPQAEHVRVLSQPEQVAGDRVQGTVAWFDAGKGFGFVSPDDGSPDVFVHVSALPFDGPLEEGERVELAVRQGDRGPQGEDVQLLDGGGAGPSPAPAGIVMQGTVSWFSDEKGFGFLVPDDLFVHGSAADGGRLEDGQRVVFEVVQGERGPQAEHVRVLGGGAPRPAPAAPAARGREPSRGGRTAGTVAWFNPDKGFGFLTRDTGGADVFVHVRALGDAGPLEEGERVEFGVTEGDRGPQATDVRRL